MESADRDAIVRLRSRIIWFIGPKEEAAIVEELERARKGRTLLDDFARAALPEILTGAGLRELPNNLDKPDWEHFLLQVVHETYDVATAMVRERARRLKATPEQSP